MFITAWFSQICGTRHSISSSAPISENSKLEHIAYSAINVNVKHAYCSVNRMEEIKNPHSWHNSISMSLLENTSICKDGGGIHYPLLGWNDNTHYTAISLHKAANGSNHSTLINKTLSFVSTWRASSISHWDSRRRAGPNIWHDDQSCKSKNKGYAECNSKIPSLHKMTIVYICRCKGC